MKFRNSIAALVSASLLLTDSATYAQTPEAAPASPEPIPPPAETASPQDAQDAPAPVENAQPATPAPAQATTDAPAPSPSAPPAQAAPEPVIPTDYPAERYHSLAERSPFTLESVEAAPPAGFTEDLVLVAIAKIDETPYVTLLNRKTQARQLVTATPNTEGISVTQMANETNTATAAVTLTKGGETGTVSYDQNLLKSVPQAPTAPPPQHTAGGQPPPPVTPGQPGAPRPPTRVTPGGTTPAPTAPRRRRVIIPAQPPANR